MCQKLLVCLMRDDIKKLMQVRVNIVERWSIKLQSAEEKIKRLKYVPFARRLVKRQTIAEKE